MAYVTVPKDLSIVKTKVAFGLTKRQLLCFGCAGLIGLPFYFLTRPVLGQTAAALGMVVLMLPLFALGLYQKDGMPLERVLWNIFRTRVLDLSDRPKAKGGGQR